MVVSFNLLSNQINWLIMMKLTLFLLQPNGYVLLRDYAVGDLAQVDLRSFLFFWLIFYLISRCWIHLYSSFFYTTAPSWHLWGWVFSAVALVYSQLIYLMSWIKYFPHGFCLGASIPINVGRMCVNMSLSLPSCLSGCWPYSKLSSLMMVNRKD